jgi:ABC-type multidrug transport system fused ATPase/permease subunit
VLEQVTLTIPARSTVALVGPTGVGKTTLVSLIPRFYDVTHGTITLDGRDLRDYTLESLRHQISIVLQDVFLFYGTVRENLLFGRPDADEQDMITAAQTANAHQFIMDLPNGYDTLIGERGVKLSGGQKQRLSIARAMVKQPPIYIFDDSFSALDFKTDAALRRALKTQTGDSTLLIVTQRVATVKNAEQIIVLEEGAMVGRGTHHELMQTCEPYKEIALSQLSMEELA